MVRTIVKEALEEGPIYFEYSGLSTDTKPVGAPISTGSLFLEVDKGDVYAYNEEGASGSEWCKIAALGGGS
jgi:hypothetical protein